MRWSLPRREGWGQGSRGECEWGERGSASDEDSFLEYTLIQQLLEQKCRVYV